VYEFLSIASISFGYSASFFFDIVSFKEKVPMLGLKSRLVGRKTGYRRANSVQRSFEGGIKFGVDGYDGEND
jgi:hypothetical protein